MSLLGTVAITKATLNLPSWGVGWADVEIAEPETLSGQVTLALLDRTFQCTVMSGGAYLNRARYRVALGAGGWGTEVDSAAYANDGGVKASKIIDDVARLSGETVSGAPSTNLGAHYTRVAGTASRALSDAVGNEWYVDDEGITQFGTRPTGEYSGDATLASEDRNAGTAEYIARSLEGFNPGVTFGELTASDVEISITSKRATVKVYEARQESRLTGALAELVRQLLPDLRYYGTYEFRVTGQAADRLNVQPVRASLGLPELARVPVSYGVHGWKNMVDPGTLALVTFVNALPSRPVVVGFAPDAAALFGVARLNDTVQAGPFAGVITSASTKAMLG